MTEFFVKLMECPKTDWLQEWYPNAFLLLIYIARHCRKTENIPDGLLKGEYIIGREGTSEAAGMTPDQYRTALEKLVEFGFVKIVSNGKTLFEERKIPIKIPIKSTIIRIINSEVCNVVYPPQSPTLSPTDPQLIPNRSPRTEKEEKEEKEENKQHLAPTASPRRNENEIFFDFEKRTFQNIQPVDLASWAEAYPNAVAAIELARMAEWILSNPTKAKGRKQWRKFITNWLTKTESQNFGRDAFKNKQTVDRRQRNADGSLANERKDWF